MDNFLFQKLTESELGQYLKDIDLALEFHIKWLSEINRVLICRTEPDIIQEDLLLNNDEYFSRWYRSVDEHELLYMSAFLRLGVIHDEAVDMAQDLLIKAQKQHAISLHDYDSFIELTSELRRHIDLVKSKIKNDLKIVAKIMGKVFENAEEGVMITDNESSILNVNQSFVRVTGYEKVEAIGQKPSFLHSGKQDSIFYTQLWDSLLRDNRWQGEIWNRRKNGETYPEWLSITAVLDDDGIVSHYIGIFSEVSTEIEGNERLYHLAHYDSLCDLPNRVLFYDRLKQSLARAKRGNTELAVLFLDLDGFKEINDQYGHDAGDNILQQVSARIQHAVRESDTFARIGGDEFTIILTEIGSTKDVEITADKLVSLIYKPFQLNGVEVTISASIGISIYPHDSMDMNTLVKKADIAMYNAKKGGKNKYYFYS